MRTRSHKHFVGLHEMVTRVPSSGVEMLPSDQVGVRAEIRDYLEGLGI
jgi:hypothetical protein